MALPIFLVVTFAGYFVLLYHLIQTRLTNEISEMIGFPAELSFGVGWATSYAIALFCLSFEVLWKRIGKNCKGNRRYELRFEDDLDFESQAEIGRRSPIQVLTIRARPLSTRINVENQDNNLARALRGLLERYDEHEGGGQAGATNPNETRSHSASNNESPRTLHDLYIDDSIDREAAMERESPRSTSSPSLEPQNRNEDDRNRPAQDRE